MAEMLDSPIHGVSRRQRSAWDIQRAVLFALLLRELKTRFGGRWLGAIWVVCEPLAHVLLMMLLFGYWRQRVLPGVDYVMFLITGLMPFFMFKSLVLRLMEAIDANRGLFGYRQVKPMDALISRAVLETGLYSLVYLLVLGLLAWFGLQVMPDRPLELIAVSAALLVGGFGTGLTLAVVTDDLPQARMLVRVAFFPLYLMSGVVFPMHALPLDAAQWLLWNPVLHALEVSRHFYLNGYQSIPQASSAFVAAFALTMLGLGLSLYRVRRHRLLAL